MELEGSSPCSQKLATVPYPEPVESSSPIKWFSVPKTDVRGTQKTGILAGLP